MNTDNNYNQFNGDNGLNTNNNLNNVNTGLNNTEVNGVNSVNTSLNNTEVNRVNSVNAGLNNTEVNGVNSVNAGLNNTEVNGVNSVNTGLNNTPFQAKEINSNTSNMNNATNSYVSNETNNNTQVSSPLNNQINNMGQPINNNTNLDNNKNKAKSNKMLFIGIGVLVVIAVVLFLIFGNNKGKTNNSYTDYLEEEKKESENLIKNLEINTIAKSVMGDVLISVNNKNSNFVYLNGNIKFYDAGGVQVDDDDMILTCLQSGTTNYYFASTNQSYETFKILDDSLKVYKVVDNSFYDCVNYKDKYTFNINYNGDEKKYELLFTNNTGKTINVSGYMVYYVNDKLYTYKYVNLFSIENGASVREKYSLPYDDNYNYVVPSNVEFLLSTIYSS